MKKLIALSLMFFVLGFFSSKLLNDKKISEDTAGEIRQGGYMFINPLLECRSSEILSEKKTADLKNAVEKEIEKEKDSGSISKVSVYYRDLNNGPWFGINEKERFTPASLLKVPVMITYLKEAETNPSLLLQRITASESDFVLERNVNTSMTLRPGNSYAIEDLLERMIIHSDNDSFGMLTKNIPEEKITKIHTDLSIPPPAEDTPENYITVKAYSSLFRVLYNASYLNREMSEKALEILSRTDYQDGLVAGMPQETNISHKFGIRSYPDSNDKQLHDCGIVYATNNPYLLCVMTRGTDMDKLSETIKNISKVIYEKTTNK